MPRPARAGDAPSGRRERARPTARPVRRDGATNMIERLVEEVRRREKVMRTFPNVDSAHRLVSAFCAETHEEWSTGRRYLDMDEYFQWRADQSDEEALGEETSLNGELTTQPIAVPA